LEISIDCPLHNFTDVETFAIIKMEGAEDVVKFIAIQIHQICGISSWKQTSDSSGVPSDRTRLLALEVNR
jgi:hypothetical protein